MKKLSRILFLILLLSALRYPLNAANAAIPRLINYQGRLTDKSDVPLNGAYNLAFRIYDAETAGSLLWEEAHSGLVIQKGIFSVQLGSVTSLNLAFDKQYWLEVKVGEEVMSPRQRIASSAYAIRAERAEAADAINIPAENGDILYYNNGWGKLSKGSNGQILQVTDGTPMWGERYSSYLAGNYVEIAADNTVTTTNYSYEKVKEIQLGARGGIVTITFQLKDNDDGPGLYTAFARIYKNGSPIGIERTTTSKTWEDGNVFLENITVAAYDLIQLYLKTTHHEHGGCSARNFRIKVSNPTGAGVLLN